MSFLFGPSPIERKIETCTSDLLIDSDWGLNTEVWELIRRSEDGGKEIAKAIRKRIDNKNRKICHLALTLLESCIMNCDNFFTVIGNKDYLKVVVETAKRKAEPPKPDVGAKALQLIEDWAASFKDKRFAFVETYDSMRKKGVIFPVRDTPPVPAKTPAKKVDPEAKMMPSSAPGGGISISTGATAQREVKNSATTEHKSSASVGGGGAANGTPSPYSWCSPQYIVKVKRELQQVVEFIQVARSMVVISDKPGAVLRQDSILAGLITTLTEIRSRLSRLLVETDLDNESLIDIVIRMNEEVRVVVDFYQERIRDKLIPLPEMAIPPAIYDVGDAKPVTAESKHGDYKLDAAAAAAASSNVAERKTGVVPVLDFSAFEQKPHSPPAAAVAAPGAAPVTFVPVAQPAEDDDPFSRLASRTPASPAALSPGTASPAIVAHQQQQPVAASEPLDAFDLLASRSPPGQVSNTAIATPPVVVPAAGEPDIFAPSSAPTPSMLFPDVNVSMPRRDAPFGGADASFPSSISGLEFMADHPVANAAFASPLPATANDNANGAAPSTAAAVQYDPAVAMSAGEFDDLLALTDYKAKPATQTTPKISADDAAFDAFLRS